MKLTNMCWMMMICGGMVTVAAGAAGVAWVTRTMPRSPIAVVVRGGWTAAVSNPAAGKDDALVELVGLSAERHARALKAVVKAGEAMAALHGEMGAERPDEGRLHGLTLEVIGAEEAVERLVRGASEADRSLADRQPSMDRSDAIAAAMKVRQRMPEVVARLSKITASAVQGANRNGQRAEKAIEDEAKTLRGREAKAADEALKLRTQLAAAERALAPYKAERKLLYDQLNAAREELANLKNGPRPKVAEGGRKREPAAAAR